MWNTMKRLLSILLCFLLIRGNVAMANPGTGVAGSQLKTVYQYDKGFYTAGINAIDQVITQSIGDLIDYTYYIGTVGTRVILTDYQYEAYKDAQGKTRNRITSITDCTTGKYIEYGALIDSNGKAYGWGGLAERDRSGRLIGAYNYDAQGRLVSKDIFGMTAAEESQFEIDNAALDAEINALLYTNNEYLQEISELNSDIDALQSQVDYYAGILTTLTNSLQTVDEVRLGEVNKLIALYEAKMALAKFETVGFATLYSDRYEKTYYATGLMRELLIIQMGALGYVSKIPPVGVGYNISFVPAAESLNVNTKATFLANAKTTAANLLAAFMQRNHGLFTSAVNNLGSDIQTIIYTCNGIGLGNVGAAALAQLLSNPGNTSSFDAKIYLVRNLFDMFRNQGGLSKADRADYNSLKNEKKKLDEKVTKNATTDKRISAILALALPFQTDLAVKTGLRDTTWSDYYAALDSAEQEKAELQADADEKRNGTRTDDTVKFIDLEHKAVQHFPQSLKDKIALKQQLLAAGDYKADEIQFTDEEVALIATAILEIMEEIKPLLDKINDLEQQIDALEEKIRNISELIKRLEERRGRAGTSTIYYKTIIKDGKSEQVMDKEVSFYRWGKKNGDDEDSQWIQEAQGGRVSKVWNYGTDGKLLSATAYKIDFKQVNCKVEVSVDDNWGLSHTEERNGVKNVETAYEETTCYDENEKATSIMRDGKVVGTFTYDKFGRLTDSVYNDITGMKTTTLFDAALGRAKQSITEGKHTYMQKMSWFEDEYGKKITGKMKVTVNVKTVTDYNYNDTGKDLLVKENGVEYKVSGGGLISAKSTTDTKGSFSAKTGEWYYKMDITNKINTTSVNVNYMRDGEKFNTYTQTDNNSTTTSDETLATKIGWTVIEAVIGVVLIAVAIVIAVFSAGTAAAVGVGAVAGVVGLITDIVTSWMDKARVDKYEHAPVAPVSDNISTGGYAELSLRPPTQPPKAPVMGMPLQIHRLTIALGLEHVDHKDGVLANVIDRRGLDAAQHV